MSEMKQTRKCRCLNLQCIFRYVNAADVIKRRFNLAWWNNGLPVLRLLWLHTSRSPRSWPAGKSILGVSVAVTSGSHLFVRDLAPFKLLSPFSRAVLDAKLSCHWWRQMTSIPAYGRRSKDGLQDMWLRRADRDQTPPSNHTLYTPRSDLSIENVPISAISK